MENLNLPPFVKGDRVVCIESNITNVVKKGRHYTVISVKQNRCCKSWVINVGTSSYYTHKTCATCGTIRLEDEFYTAARFRKVQESKFRAVSFEKIMEETEKVCVN